MTESNAAVDLLHGWSQDLDESRRGQLTPLIARMTGVPADGADAWAWRSADYLVRTHAAAWLQACSEAASAARLRSLGQIADEATAQDAADVVNDVDASLREVVEAIRTRVQKQTWSLAWPSAWNMESSTRWASRRDLAISAAWNGCWRAATTALRNEGTLALDAASRFGAPDGPGTLGSAATELCRKSAYGVAWPGVWNAAWNAATSADAVNSVLSPLASGEALAIVTPISDEIARGTLEWFDQVLNEGRR